MKVKSQLGVIVWKTLIARLSSWFIFDELEQESANSFYKRLDRKWFSLHRSYDLCQNYSTPLL